MMAWTTKYGPSEGGRILQENYPLLEKALLAKQHVLLAGPVGSGKSCAVYAFARARGWEVLEINASDSRNKKEIESLLGGAGLQMSLFSRHKVILVDEAEGLSGTKDRGGATALAKLLAQVKFPVVVTVNDASSPKVKALKKKMSVVEFTPYASSILVPFLEEVCKLEGVTYSLSDLKQLALMSNGDLRAALNDLQVHSSLGVFDLSGVVDRSVQGDLGDALTLVFKGRRLGLVRGAFDGVAENLDHCFLWVDENLPYEYKEPVDLLRGYEALSSADIFRSRILRWQYWRFLVYQNLYMTCGVAFAKDARYPGEFRLKRMTRLLSIWRANMKNQKKKAISSKIALESHRSTKAVFKDFGYYRSFIDRASDVLNLSDDERIWLSK